MNIRTRCNARAHRHSRRDITGPLVTWAQASGVTCIDLYARTTNAIYSQVNQSPLLLRYCLSASLLLTPFSVSRSRLPNTSPPLSNPFSLIVSSGNLLASSLSPLLPLVNTWCSFARWHLIKFSSFDGFGNLLVSSLLHCLQTIMDLVS